MTPGLGNEAVRRRVRAARMDVPMLCRIGHAWVKALESDANDYLGTARTGQHPAEPCDNLIAFPRAAGVLWPLTLSPEIAALSMSGCIVRIAINPLLLKGLHLSGNRARQGRRTNADLPCPLRAPQ